MKNGVLSMQCLLVIIAISNVCFVVCPVRVHLRSQALESAAAMRPVFRFMFEGLWLVDSPYNSWPR